MINFINKGPKWPKMIKSDSAYLQSFNRAILNFEQNIREERQLKEVSIDRKHRLASGS
ncbi:hypothetical protein MASR2M41_15780 [Flammeovirgaceae bacterium]